MKEQWFDVGQKPDLEITCNGDLVIQTGTDASIVTRADNITIDGGIITSEGDLKMLVPHGSKLNIVRVEGDLKVKGVEGSVKVDQVMGDAGFASVGGAVEVQIVEGDLKAISLSAGLTVNSVHGDLNVRNAGSLLAQIVEGDASVHNVDGDVTVNGVHGDLAVKSVAGILTVNNVDGDCAIDNLAGVANVNVNDDIRINGPLGPGKHTFNSGSTITMRWPARAPLNLTANAPDIHNRLQLNIVKQTDRSLSGSLGDGDCTVTLTANNRVTLRHDARSESRNDWEGFMDFEFDMAGFGEKISAEINAKMADLTNRVGPEISIQIERAMRQAQEAVDKVANRFEVEIEREREEEIRRSAPRPRRGRPKADATPPAPPPAPAKPQPDVSAAQVKILKMLEEGKLTVDEANDLLATLG